MDIPTFLEFFVRELEKNPELHAYYRLLERNGKFHWRKAYLEQRLEYVNNHLGITSGRIWDVGCGYATTSIFLALNGYDILGNTLEFYYDKIARRLDYWSQFGKLDNLKIEYANVFDMPVAPGQFDVIIAQDTLHHLEPVQEAMDRFRNALKHGGRLVVTEENGNCVFIFLKNFSKRGFKRVTDYYDERLGKNIRFGNENARSLHTWRKILERSGLRLMEQESERVRLLPPWCFNQENYRQQILWEKKAGKVIPGLQEILFFGINFTAVNDVQLNKQTT
jgi:SAM-dependent methyltransferase